MYSSSHSDTEVTRARSRDSVYDCECRVECDSVC